MVRISEGTWPETQDNLDRSYGNCEGWMQMIACMKVYLEHGFNLREGFVKQSYRNARPYARAAGRSRSRSRPSSIRSSVNSNSN